MSLVRILPPARERLLGIWEYTAETWGEEQADIYVSGLIGFLNGLTGRRKFWRRVKEPRFPLLYCSRYRRHFVFFRELEGGLGVISILHENMDLPNRLRDDFDDLTDEAGEES